MENREGRIGTGTYVSLGLLVALIGMGGAGVYTFGVQSQKIVDLESRVARQELYAADLITVKEQVKNIVGTLTEVRDDVKDIKNTQEDEK